MKRTAEETRCLEAFREEFPICWMCLFLAWMKSGWRRPYPASSTKAELHHIAGRGRNHDVRKNYCSLCRRHHTAIQSLKDAELICLVLKRRYDTDYYSPEPICRLRSRAETGWTDADVAQAERIMVIMREC